MTTITRVPEKGAPVTITQDRATTGAVAAMEFGSTQLRFRVLNTVLVKLFSATTTSFEIFRQRHRRFRASVIFADCEIPSIGHLLKEKKTTTHDEKRR